MLTLYVVATPIGNLEDITLRALRVLREVGVIATEDTRTTAKLLAHYGISTPRLSYYTHNARLRLPQILERLEREDVALVSEAGTPGVSDPGSALVEAALERGIPVVSVPGPSAVPAALAASGLPADSFLFLGFLPRRPAERRALWRSVAGETRTLVAFEAPHRLRTSLQDALAVLGDRRLAVCRELTKMHEEVFRGTLSQALARFTEPRGEFTLVLAGASSADVEGPPDLEAVREALRRLRDERVPVREATAQVAAAYGLSRREAYRLWLEERSHL
ncbi:MAG: 16S rRNA (cytidine(1402)-2'-O)-methyltransferase [Chloroflexi bacterium]|nr:16S rRNA (cytidine(1402)-2'-O)-methyltransferase [Chloroflexota bacterium]